MPSDGPATGTRSSSSYSRRADEASTTRASTRSPRRARASSCTRRGDSCSRGCGERRNGDRRLRWLAKMSEPQVPNPFGDMLRDAPLFQELQRILFSSSGPVNWELARQIAVASAASAGDDSEPSDADRHTFDEAARVAELQVASFTGLEPPSDVAVVRAVRRADWIQANTESLRPLLEPAAEKLGSAFADAQRQAMP